MRQWAQAQERAREEAERRAREKEGAAPSQGDVVSPSKGAEGKSRQLSLFGPGVPPPSPMPEEMEKAPGGHRRSRKMRE